MCKKILGIFIFAKRPKFNKSIFIHYHYSSPFTTTTTPHHSPPTPPPYPLHNPEKPPKKNQQPKENTSTRLQNQLVTMAANTWHNSDDRMIGWSGEGRTTATGRRLVTDLDRLGQIQTASGVTRRGGSASMNDEVGRQCFGEQRGGADNASVKDQAGLRYDDSWWQGFMVMAARDGSEPRGLDPGNVGQIQTASSVTRRGRCFDERQGGATRRWFVVVAVRGDGGWWWQWEEKSSGSGMEITTVGWEKTNKKN